MLPFDENDLMINPRFLARELAARDIEVELVDVQEQVLSARLGDHVELFADVVCGLAPAPALAFAKDKRMAKRILTRAGLPTPLGERFAAHDVHEAQVFAGRIGFPVVIKPLDERQGRGVETHLASYEELEEAIARVTRPGRPTFLVEKQIAGEEVRVFITRAGAWAAVRREPASVVGDGQRNILDLAAAETARRTSPRTSCLGPIEIDDNSIWFLKRTQGRTPFDVPSAGERVFVRGHVDGQGAFVADITHEIDVAIVAQCRVALDAFGLPYAGFDVRVLAGSSITILEVNVTPAFGIHTAPGAGRGRNVVGAVVDLVFPETARTTGTSLRAIE